MITLVSLASGFEGRRAAGPGASGDGKRLTSRLPWRKCRLPPFRHDECHERAGVRLGDQDARESGPPRQRDALLTERLHADVVGAGAEVCADNLGDLLRVALRDDGVDQPVRATIGTSASLNPKRSKFCV